MKTHGTNSNEGFTLLELIVGILIVSILSIIGFTNYHNFRETQKLNSETQKVAEAINLARQNALSGFRPTGCTPTNGEYEFNTSLVAGEYTYSVNPKGCAALFSERLPNKITITTLNASDIVSFKPMNGQPDQVIDYTVTNQTITKTKTINVNDAGTITVQ